ncbi:Protein hold'em [Pseudolycoriella hygida]|uniref:Protein hold'em n=1 Tax=Pseudolycoriella hygida TaxID=35572 RepID=A0A9Q0NAC8_9DIPT|nr:Protein hold'em [Pseudolycoriella hygida]
MSLNNFSIAALHPNANNFKITGIIIGKSNMSTFEKSGQQNGVVKFIIRDSNDHYINCTVWGTAQFIEEYNVQFKIGQVVNVLRSKISNVRHDNSFDPITSSSLQLTVNEGFGTVECFDGDVAQFVKLLNVPLKSTDLALNLADIASANPSDSGDFVDLLVVVAKLKPKRQLKNKGSVRDVIVIDQTLPGMFLTIWNEAWIDRSDSWDEMSTTLHLINISFKYSEFQKSNILETRTRTIIIVDPKSERSTALKDYVLNSTLSLTDFDTSEPDLASITTVMTLRQIADRIDSSTESVFHSLTYAMVTHMDIDGWSPFYSRRCIHCNCQIRVKETSCNKENCSIFFAESPLDEHYINYFNIPISLTDHTGTIEQCRLIGDTAERIIGHTLHDFLKLSDAERTAIKWKFLMERCSVKLWIKRKTALRWNTQIVIVDCQLANPAEVLEKIKVY